MSAIKTTLALCRMVKIEHSIFALPFAFSGAVLAAQGWPKFSTILFLTVAMISIRSFAMAVNRLADVEHDAKNPRTKNRQLVTGEITLRQAHIFTGAAALLFLLSCAALNSLCLALSPLALLLAAAYSYTKHLTYLCHFVLGAVLGLAPIAGWLSVAASFSIIPLLLFWAVLFWVAGFDIIYATQDAEFDKQQGLNSIPAKFDTATSLAISAFCHVITVIFLSLAGGLAGLSFIWYPVLFTISGILYYEHHIISPTDLSRVNAAFFYS